MIQNRHPGAKGERNFLVPRRAARYNGRNTMETDEVSVVGRDFSDREVDRVPSRPWFLIFASVLLAVLAAWTGIQYKRSAQREQRLRAELKQVYLEAENLRSVATQWRERAILIERQTSALTVERDRLTRRIRQLEAELAAPMGRRGGRPPAGRAVNLRRAPDRGR